MQPIGYPLVGSLNQIKRELVQDIKTPNSLGNGVRVDQGNPNHSLPSQQVDHVVDRRNGQVIGRDGNSIQGSIKQNAENAHVPLSEYQKWGRWDSP